MTACGTCTFFRPDPPGGNRDTLARPEDLPARGECWRFPPQIVATGKTNHQTQARPHVYDRDTCGEWSGPVAPRS